MLTQQQELNEALLWAARFGNVEEMEDLLSQGAYINYYDDDKYTPLFDTVIKGDYEGSKFLLTKGANPNARNYRRETPIMFAKTPEMIKLLAAFKANPILQNRDGDTAYELYFINKKTELIKAWADAGLQRPQLRFKVKNDVKGCMKNMRKLEKMLFKAVSAGNIDLIKDLVREKGINVNIATRPDKVTPLMIAARENNASIINLLLSLGADINAEDYIERNSIDIALKYGAEAALIELIAHEGEVADAN